MSAAASNVYVFKSDHTGLIKIGQSRDPQRRLRDVQNASGLVIDLAHARELENASAVERAAHIVLDAKRRNGEWFDVTVEEAIAAIDFVIDGLLRGERFLKAPWLMEEAALSVVQCRIARAALGWGMRDLAERAGVSANTIERFENGRNEPIPATLKAIRQAFEAAGVRFNDQGGVDPPEKAKK